MLLLWSRCGTKEMRAHSEIGCFSPVFAGVAPSFIIDASNPEGTSGGDAGRNR
ncbi:MAG TPA: hypothetical protein VGH49_12085 [Xanthobacteraceae bacterium]|jgi:hypothetical protein